MLDSESEIVEQVSVGKNTEGEGVRGGGRRFLTFGFSCIPHMDLLR